MTCPHLADMEENDGSKGDNRGNNNNTKEPTRDVTMTNGNDSAFEEGKVEGESTSSRQNSGKAMDRSKHHKIPTVTVENPTPTPRQVAGGRKEKRDEEDDEDDDEEEEDMDYDTGEEEEVEEEEEDTEMTPEEKQAMYETVKEGDIDAFEDCLDLPNADINMVWFQENLLMAAIKSGHTEMAEFLVDNGVDHTYTTSRLSVRDLPDGRKKFDRYEMDCRQMAFEYDLEDLVYLLDYLQGRLFSFVPAPKRSPRMRRPPPPPITPTDSNMDDEGNSSDADVSDTDTSSQVTQDEKRDNNNNDGDENRNSDATIKKKRKKKKGKSLTSDKSQKGQSQSQSQGQANEEDEEDGEVEEKDKTAWTGTGSTFTEVDSGNYSMASSKLKKSMVEKHNKLLELDLDGKDGGVVDGGDNSNKSKSRKTNSPRKSASGTGSDKTRRSRLKEQGDNDNDNEDEGGQGGGEDGTSRTETSRSKLTSIVSLDLGPPLPVVPHPPNDLIRYNRSALAVQKSQALRRFYTAPLNESNLETPLAWKKVSAPGSYIVESKKWHSRSNSSSRADISSTSTSTSNVTISHKRGIERAASSGTISLLAGNESKLLPKSILSSSSSLSSSQRMVSTASSMPSRANSSLLAPPPPSSTASSSSLPQTPQQSSLSTPTSSSSSPRPTTISISSRKSSVTPPPPPSSILKSAPITSGEKHIRFSSTDISNNKHNNQASVASYMRPTQSTITKNRLHPRFVDSYGGLDFYHVTTGRSQVFKLSLKSEKPTDTKPPLALSLTSSNSKQKSTPQRRSHNAISYRS